MKKGAKSGNGTVADQEALVLHTCIATLMREFRLAPGLLAGSVYADLHANDVGLLEILADGPGWNVRRIAQALSAPISTISSALDRLEQQDLIERKRIADDRRVVRIELTESGRRLTTRIRKAHIENCRAMLARLGPDERSKFLLLATQLTRD